MKRLFPILSLFLILEWEWGCDRPKVVEPEIPFKSESMVLDTLTGGIAIEDLQFSPDGTEVVYLWTASDGRQGFAINGRIERYFDDVGEFIHYTRDGTHYAYRARRGKKEFIVFDGTEGEHFDKVSDPVLSVTGRALAYAAKSGEDAFIVFNGRRLGSKDYDLITPPKLSPDGKRVAYSAKKSGRWLSVVDGKEGKPYDEVEEGYFSRDSRSFAHAARQGSKWVFVRNGKEQGEYEEVGVYPEAAEADVFTAKENGKSFVVFRGKRGNDYDHVGWPRVSGDGKRVAYEAKKGEKALVLVDGKDGREGKTYDMVGRPAFSPDGRQFAYDAVDGLRFLMVRNGLELTDYIAMPNPTFSPLGGKLAYGAVNRDASKKFAVEEGIQGKAYDRVSLLVWSPDGRHLAYAAREGDKAFLVVDGREGKPFDAVLSLVPRFSGDGKFVGVNAMKGVEVWWAVEPVERALGEQKKENR